MTDRDRSLEAALFEIGRNLEFPAAPSLEHRVVDRIRNGAAGRARPRRLGMRVALAGAVALAAAMVVVIAIPDTRRAVADWLGVDGIRIEFSDETPAGPVGDDLVLGRRVTLDEATRDASFEVRVPGALGAPDAVYLDPNVPGGEVTLAYAPTDDLPEFRDTGVAVLVGQFRGGVEPNIMKKVADSGVQVLPVMIDGAEGFWLSGAPHLLYEAPGGDLREATPRFAANTLIWERDGITYRIEASLGLDRVLEIARSIQ